MPDSQLPRFQVFLQEKPGEPFQDVGSVHAPDGELALQNARDVFVRRPECASLWVAPVSAIYSQTSQELTTRKRAGETNAAEGEHTSETYMVFTKQKSAGTQVLIGDVLAASGKAALNTALNKFKGIIAFTWWVVPARQITKSTPEEAESMFAPANDKPFRLSTDFHTLTAMRSLAESGRKRSDI
jgi:ring-1,2-phenylacetyl-CoA epoxidase subunit PaaB